MKFLKARRWIQQQQQQKLGFFSVSRKFTEGSAYIHIRFPLLDNAAR